MANEWTNAEITNAVTNNKPYYANGNWWNRGKQVAAPSLGLGNIAGISLPDSLNLMPDTSIEGADIFGSKALNIDMNNAITDSNASKNVFGTLGSTAIAPTNMNAAMAGNGLLSRSFDPNMSMEQFNALAEMDPVGAQKLGAAGVAFGKDGAQTGLFNQPKSDGTGWGMDGYGGVAIGAGQLGLGALGYLDNVKTAGKQRALLDQQLVSNNQALAEHTADRKHVNDVFRGA